ncbi:uncharacterized protein SAPINGB_P001311 [Magnusiomyces paraingens]|uniref:Uncharacterized protein n=1 Tax=Magnusiomyces paraingens TaxID=2606893 RepID=A0A5E8BB88_9ASCO|nr:uncharacterized protein SAPINGB_P001311 [Saprochaete ingens]VVT46634.1 unnamed protein product [Saprochaete ingens]
MNPQSNNVSNTQPPNNSSLEENFYSKIEFVLQFSQDRREKNSPAYHTYNRLKQRAYKKRKKKAQAFALLAATSGLSSPHTQESPHNKPILSSSLPSSKVSVKSSSFPYSSPSHLSGHFKASHPSIDSRNHFPPQLPPLNPCPSNQQPLLFQNPVPQIQQQRSVPQIQQPYPGSQILQPYPGSQVPQPYPGSQVSQPYPGSQIPQPYPVPQIPQPYPVSQIPQPYPVSQIQQPYPGSQVPQPYPGSQVSQPYPGSQIPQSYPVSQIPQPYPIYTRPPLPIPEPDVQHYPISLNTQQKPTPEIRQTVLPSTSEIYSNCNRNSMPAVSSAHGNDPFLSSNLTNIRNQHQNEQFRTSPTCNQHNYSCMELSKTTAQQNYPRMESSMMPTQQNYPRMEPSMTTTQQPTKRVVIDLRHIDLDAEDSSSDGS